MQTLENLNYARTSCLEAYSHCDLDALYERAEQLASVMSAESLSLVQTLLDALSASRRALGVAIRSLDEAAMDWHRNDR